MGELRKEGLIEARGTLFVYLARYSYLQTKSARIDVKIFIQSVPDQTFHQVSPAYRVSEVEAVLRILVEAGLATIEEETDSQITKILLTERKAAVEVALGQDVHSIVMHLKNVFGSWDPDALVSHKGKSFPTIDSVVKETGVDRSHLSPEAGCLLLDDRPATNDTNENPFLQSRLEQAKSSLVLLRFWALPDPRGGGEGTEPEMVLLSLGEQTLDQLLRDFALPILSAYFRSNDHHEAAAEIQSKFATYMHKYRERFTSGGGMPTADRVDKVLTSVDPDGDVFANAAYVVSQMLRRSPCRIAYQAARIAYARVMALRVRKRSSEKEAAARTADINLLVTRLKDSSRPLPLDELKRTPDASRKREIGSKYTSVLELLPLTAEKEGRRPDVFEIGTSYVHRENLIRAFLDLRDQEALLQRERLARTWAADGIPTVEGILILDQDLTPDFFRVLEALHQERVLSPGTTEFLRDFLPSERDLQVMSRSLWPEGHRGSLSALEVLTRGLDPILYEDRDRLRRRSLAGVLGLPSIYPQIVKDTWNIIFSEDGLFLYVLRKLAALFGGRGGSRKKKKVKEAKEGKSGSGGESSPLGTRGASGSSSNGGPGGNDAKGQKAAELNKLKEIAPLLKDREALLRDREKAAAGWCIKLDPEANRRTRQAVDDEVARLMPKILVEKLSEENGAQVALFLVEKSSILSQVTSSRSYHRYLYLTALLRKAEGLGR